MKFRTTLLLLALTAICQAQTIYTGPSPCGKIRYFSLENSVDVMWYLINDSTGELHYFDLKKQVGCLVNVTLDPEAEPVYTGSSDLFFSMKIDLKNSSRVRLEIKDKENSEPVVITIPATPSTQAVPVDYHCFSALRAIYYDTEEGRDSVTMSIEHLYPVPAPGTPGKDSLDFVKAILSMYEDLPFDAVYPDDIIKNIDIGYVQEYTSMYESGEAEIDDVFANWEIYDEISVMYQKNGLIGFVASGYDYTGGVHGNYGSVNYTYDSETGKLLTLTDIFSENYDLELELAINAQLRSEMNISEDASLEDEGFFVASIPLTENYLLSETGITFHYNIYEIAPYAAGSFDITVPYTAIRSVIRPNGVIERMIK